MYIKFGGHQYWWSDMKSYKYYKHFKFYKATDKILRKI